MTVDGLTLQAARCRLEVRGLSVKGRCQLWLREPSFLPVLGLFLQWSFMPQAPASSPRKVLLAPLARLCDFRGSCVPRRTPQQSRSPLAFTDGTVLFAAAASAPLCSGGLGGGWALGADQTLVTRVPFLSSEILAIMESRSNSWTWSLQEELWLGFKTPVSAAHLRGLCGLEARVIH